MDADARLTLAADHDTFRDDIVAGLSRPEKSLPPKHLYDDRGSALFDQICELPEYYPTRTEKAILRRRLPELRSLVPDGSVLIEFGSGSSEKIRLLLEGIEDRLFSYVPVDISAEYLGYVNDELQRDYPQLRIDPIAADFTKPFPLPSELSGTRHRVGFFPGSTIGNFERSEAVDMLRAFTTELGTHGGLIIGVDLLKSPEIILPAYDDSQGVTAAFIGNILQRANMELDADFDVDRFEYRAEFVEEHGRIDMCMVSTANQCVSIDDTEIEFSEGESIHVSSSRKFTFDSFAKLAAEAGLRVDEIWTDPEELFSVQYLVAE
ncbi:Histidine-specific methyltransferase EgtD [Stratiformator vulcanicus]|uniref:Histidine-specific methyltransferase EgtD n=2 Tax=Stratiformator vulcanicus TaxID=2527980 RepID=A0A517R1Y6_9PLAN|nr:Histidine-specific methyltransferase EgtD [Stratiformator vulcanicus]